MPIGDFNPVPKSGIIHNRTKETQKQMGAISAKVRKQVRDRSGGICEVKEKCTGAPATEQAHLTGRGTIKHKTTAADLKDACVECHRWLDSTGEGVKHKKSLRG
ncbi:hypothetical protein SD71_10635 [Cohnella kolymensis]|uniref:HNH domain-containing protein n=1 Tax=Cohnella kolymensis TaxID=1590652 RepID=A0ABR5A477_9BACL|nr:hypothetical protein [Cohnella kolymensis]KIL35846.1 hypothetical protein SD71_10635 [Cohnella kolymensis]